jgi:hypothetical protein
VRNFGWTRDDSSGAGFNGRSCRGDLSGAPDEAPKRCRGGREIVTGCSLSSPVYCFISCSSAKFRAKAVGQGKEAESANDPWLLGTTGLLFGFIGFFFADEAARRG